MATLYIDRQGSTLQVAAGQLQITTPDGQGNKRVPLKFLDRVVMRADTQLGSRALCAMAEAGVHVLALGGRGGHQLAQLTGSAHNDARRRWQQVLVLSRPEACAQIALKLVRSKVRRQQQTLARMAIHRPDLRKPLFDGQKRLQGILQILNTAADAQTLSGLDSLRGLEGAAAAHYFEAFFVGFAPALGATVRNRRPPRDPVNAVLSLAYTMLYGQATSACLSAGLDPALGALHTLSHGRAALACDLMEPFRPGVDLWVWQLFRQGTLRAEHFGHDGSGACLLGKAGRSFFYPAWEQHARLLQQVLLRYARALTKGMANLSDGRDWAHLMDETEV